MSRKGLVKRYLSPFLGTDRAGGSIRPPFAWATLFCLLAAVAAGIQIADAVGDLLAGRKVVLEPTIATLAGLAAAMVAVYNQGRKVSALSDAGRMGYPPGSTTSRPVDAPEGPRGASLDPAGLQSKAGGGL